MFSQEVTLFESMESGALPQIILNTISSSGSDALYRELLPTQEGSFSRTVSFEYAVKIIRKRSSIICQTALCMPMAIPSRMLSEEVRI